MFKRNYQGKFPKTIGRLLGLGLILLYQCLLSPFIGQHCRHSPTCSEYAYEAVARHGLWAGFWLVVGRFGQCNPLGRRPYFDEVPRSLPENSCWFLPWRYLK